MSKKICGIGNAIVDFLIPCSEEDLVKLNITKGSMTLIDENFIAQIDKNKITKSSLGGSVCNSIVTINQLNNATDFIGCVGNDEAGKVFFNDLKNANSNFCGLVYEGAKTARSYIFITPDGQRTMCTYLGCASDFNDLIIKKINFSNIDILLIEGYLFYNANIHKFIDDLIIIAKKNNIKIALSLSDFNCVKILHQNFIELLKNHVDIVFANELEILNLAQIDNFNLTNLSQFLFNINPQLISIVTRSDKGCVIFYDQNIQEFEGLKIKKIIDSTGAGDIFAAGFIYKFNQKDNFEQCANFANFLASEIIQNYGARFSKDQLSKILTKNS